MLPAAVALHLRSIVRHSGPPIPLYRANVPTPEQVNARVRWLNAVELANAIEAYPLVVTLPADQVATAPAKGDEFLIEGARRAIMQVREIFWGATLVAYQCGVQG